MFEYCHVSVIFDNVDVLCLEEGNEYRPVLKKNLTTTMFFSQKKNFRV